MAKRSFHFKKQNLVILEQLLTLEDIALLPDNFVLFDCGSFGEQAKHEAVLCFQTLTKNFHIIVIECNTVLPDFVSLHRGSYTISKNVPSSLLRNVKNPSEHLVTLIMAYIAEQKAKYTRRAYYCLSADHSFPVSTKMIDVVGHEFVYCCIIKSVKDFVSLQKCGHFSYYDDPTKMRLYRILQNSIPRDFIPSKGGKLMHFVRDQHNIEEKVKSLWQELKQFGDRNSLHVNVTTAFPSVDYLIIQKYPERTKPEFYRFLIYLPDASEYEAVSALELLKQQTPMFRNTVWSIKGDDATKEKQFSSLGHRDIARAQYKIRFSNVCKKMDTRTYKDLHLYDDYIEELLHEAKLRGATMKVRYAKVLFCGASGAGKTSFCQLLKHKPFNEKHISTGVADAQQIMISEKAAMKGNILTELDPAEEIHQLKLRLKYKKLSEFRDSDTPKEIAEEFNDLKVECTSQPVDRIPNEADSSFNSSSAANNLVQQPVPKLQCKVDKQLASTFYNSEKESKEPPLVWDILTLLDTGGQPQFINMLPAVNTSAAITFVVLNMMGGVKSLDEKVLVYYNKDGNVPSKYKSYPMNYTNKDLIKCLVALLKDSIVRNIPPLPAEYVAKEAKESKPGLCFVGTHLDKVEQEDVDKISEVLEEIVKELEASSSINILYLNKLLLAVDNTIAGKDCPQNKIANNIQLKIKEMLENAAVYDVPITWIMLELEIRQECSKRMKSFLPFSDVVKLYENIVVCNYDAPKIELQVKVALQFHHRFGVLLYFHDVLGMNEYVISNPQWLFANLTNLVTCSFEETFVDHGDLDRLKSCGILSKKLIEKINTDSLEGVNIEYFLELLKYLRIITPYPARDSSDYLMLTVLDSYKGQSKILGDIPSFECVELLVQFQSGTLPRGIFSCLVVQLVENKSDEWELQINKNCIYANLVTFYIKAGCYLFILDKISHIEIQLRPVKEVHKSVYCKVQESITTALSKICSHSENNFKYGFYCKHQSCLKPLMKLSAEDMTGQDIPSHLLCEEHGFMELTTHKIWCQKSNTAVDKSLESSSSIENTCYPSPCTEAIVFKENYQNLISILSTGITELIPHFVTKEIITLEDEFEVRSMPKKSDQAKRVLQNIEIPLECGISLCFYEMLTIMKEHGNLGMKLLAKIIKDAL